MPEKTSLRRLAIIVVIYNMRREAPRTLYSLSAKYQLNVSSNDYDVIVVENGSTEPMSPWEVEQFGPNFRYLRIENAMPSPAAAINFGVSKSNAQFVGIMIDGARMASPGTITLALKALSEFERPIVGTLGFHLGPDIQPRSIIHGYNREVEDGLLAGINWRKNGYGLFKISTIAPSSSSEKLGKIASKIRPQIYGPDVGRRARLAENIRALVGLSESSLIFLPKTLFNELEGFDERFDLPGGGFVNLDFYKRAAELKNTTFITLYGEATFHQFHGGTMTNRPEGEVKTDEIEIYKKQYQKIRGFPFKPSSRIAQVIGLPMSKNIDTFDGKSVLLFYVDPSSLMFGVLSFAYNLMMRFRRRLSIIKNFLN